VKSNDLHLLVEHLKFFGELGVTHLNLTGSAPSQESPPPPSTLEALRAEIGDCRRCKLHAGRTNIVFGVGNPRAELMFVGEAPGADEDLQGIPFVGRAGQLLTRIIEAMGFTREDVYIANVLKCRPPENRNPEPDEVAACSGFVRRQIAVISPKIIVTLGRYATDLLIGSNVAISKVRGKFMEMEGVAVIPTFHPSYLLRNPAAKREVWEDMKAVLARLNRTVPGRG
jgi:uracil-DNA glycosylase